jgi:hypothetical protein
MVRPERRAAWRQRIEAVRPRLITQSGRQGTLLRLLAYEEVTFEDAARHFGVSLPVIRQWVRHIVRELHWEETLGFADLPLWVGNILCRNHRDEAWLASATDADLLALRGFDRRALAVVRQRRAAPRRPAPTVDSE